MREMRYYVDVAGVYLGGWDDNPPSGAIEVPFAPQDARQVWEGEGWGPIPLTFHPLTKRQVNAALILGADILGPDAFVRNALEAITDPVEKALALNDWETAPYFERSHPLFTNEDVLAAAEFTPQLIDQLWVLGWQQPK